VQALLALRFLPTVYWGAVTFLMPLLIYRLTGSEEPAGIYTGASLLVSAVCQAGAGRVVDRAGVRAPVLSAISLVTLAAVGQGLFTGSLWGLAAWGLLGAGAAWTLSITMTTLVQSLSTDETRARLLGLTHVAWSAGFLSGKLLSGYLARTRGIGDAPLVFLICGGLGMLGLGCAFLVLSGAPPRAPKA
jgi:MFS family permease